MRTPTPLLGLLILFGCGTPPAPIVDGDAGPRIEEQLYQSRLDALGGCVTYLFPESQCVDRVDGDPALIMWFTQTWLAAPTCRDLYWGRAAYCQAEGTRDVTCEEAEAAFADALSRLGGCADREPATCARTNCPDGVWWSELWASAPSCDLLYWSRGAYCELAANP